MAGVPVRGLDWLFRASSRVMGLPLLALLLGLALVAISHWQWFFGPGPLALSLEDWPKERAYLDLLRDAISTGSLPLHMDVRLQGTSRFLGIPETPLTPDVLLLPLLSNQQFVPVHVSLMCLIGLLGCWRLARRLDWRPFTLLVFAVVFSFNGFITAHLAAGHLMFTGYFLFPWALLATMRLHRDPGGVRAALGIAWTLLALLLVGAFHMAVWWTICLVVLALARPGRLTETATGLAMAGGLSMCRLGPAMITYHDHDGRFASGYPDLTTLLGSLVTSQGYGAPFTETPRVAMGWWEFDHFVGVAATVFVLVYALRPVRVDDPFLDRSALLVAAGVLATLSLSFFYAPIAELPIPFANSEHATTRFFSLAFFLLLFLACCRFDQELPGLSGTGKAIACLLLLETAFELFGHSFRWRLGRLEIESYVSPYFDNALTLTAHVRPIPHDRLYKLVVALSWLVSGATLAVALVASRRARRGDPPPVLPRVPSGSAR
jgi:hypothetical protein